MIFFPTIFHMKYLILMLSRLEFPIDFAMKLYISIQSVSILLFGLEKRTKLQ